MLKKIIMVSLIGIYALVAIMFFTSEGVKGDIPQTYVQSNDVKVHEFIKNHNKALNLSNSTVVLEHHELIVKAIDEFFKLPPNAQSLLTTEKYLLESLLERLENEIHIIRDMFTRFHGYVLGLSADTVRITHKGKVTQTLDIINQKSPTVQYSLLDKYAHLNELLDKITYMKTRVLVVTFINYNEQEFKRLNVKSGNRITIPENPSKKGHIFIGWSTSIENTNIFNFNTPIAYNFRLYAIFTIDPEIIHQVSIDKMGANMQVTRRTTYNSSNYYAMFAGVLFYAATASTGIGVNFFLLTSYNAISVPEGHTSRQISVADFRQHNNQGVVGSVLVATYCDIKNLAVLHFWIGNASVDNLPRNLVLIERGTTNPSVGDPIITMGRLNNRRNSIMIGRVNGFTSPIDKLNRSITPMVHNTLTTYDSSGSAILDMNLRLVGIQVKTLDDTLGAFEKSIAIPIEQINEFLNADPNRPWVR